MNEIRIPYKVNKIIFILAIVIFGVGAVYMGDIAITNSRGLIVNRILEFSTQGATIIYWVMAGVSSAIAIVGGFGLIKSFVSKREIVISSNSITSPKNGFSKIDVTVNFQILQRLLCKSFKRTKS
jgi:hypothetical protein